MAGQFQELLLKVSGQLQALERVLEGLKREDERQDDKIVEALGRIATLENDLRWIAEVRRKVDGRLETGDQTFKRLEARVAAAERIARDCQEKLQAKPTSMKKKIILKLVEAAAPMFVGFVWWLFYHFLLVGPKLAEIMKKAQGGHGP